MSVTQTVEIPASHRLTIDVPSEIPAGRAVLTFTPAVDQRSPNQRSANTAEEGKCSFQRLRGIHAGIPGASVDNFLARCREDKEHELAIEKRQEEERVRYANTALSS